MSGHAADMASFDRLFDGLLSGREREDLEARLRGDAELAQRFDREHELQGDLDGWLRRTFTPPADLRAIAQAALESEPEVRAGSAWRVTALRLAAAAGIVAALTFGAFWLRGAADPPLQAATLYAEVNASQVSQLGCTAHTFAALLEEQRDGMLTCTDDLALVPGGVIASEHLPTSTVLFGWRDENLVIVVIDLFELDPLPQPSGDVLVHKRRVGPFVVYELSPLTDPAVLREIVLANVR